MKLWRQLGNGVRISLSSRARKSLCFPICSPEACFFGWA
jgi:hypothetical protein